MSAEFPSQETTPSAGENHEQVDQEPQVTPEQVRSEAQEAEAAAVAEREAASTQQLQGVQERLGIASANPAAVEGAESEDRYKKNLELNNSFARRFGSSTPEKKAAIAELSSEQMKEQAEHALEFVTRHPNAYDGLRATIDNLDGDPRLMAEPAMQEAIKRMASNTGENALHPYQYQSLFAMEGVDPSLLQDPGVRKGILESAKKSLVYNRGSENKAYYKAFNSLKLSPDELREIGDSIKRTEGYTPFLQQYNYIYS